MIMSSSHSPPILIHCYHRLMIFIGTTPQDHPEQPSLNNRRTPYRQNTPDTRHETILPPYAQDITEDADSGDESLLPVAEVMVDRAYSQAIYLTTKYTGHTAGGEL
jgi:hypothetical protein